MFVVNRSTTVFRVLAAIGLVVLVLDFATPAALAQASEQSANDILQDALEALADNDSELAAQLFEQLVDAFPGTSEASRAKRELDDLDTSTQRPVQSVSPDGQSRTGGNDPTALRLQFAIEAGDRIFFAENSAVLGARARALLENQARWLAARPALKITIIGRADDGGHDEEAQLLSAQRAEAVRERLAAAGIPVARISIDARGPRDPVATCGTPMCQAQNRQAETSIGGAFVTGAGGMVPGSIKRSGGATVGGVDGGITVSR